jgi:hypothetical protein
MTKLKKEIKTHSFQIYIYEKLCYFNQFLKKLDYNGENNTN